MIAEILSAAYDVALGLIDWRQLLDMLAESLDSRSVALFEFDDRIGSADILATSGKDDREQIDAYLAIARRMAPPMDAPRRPEPREPRQVAPDLMSGRTTRWTSHSESGPGYYVAGMRLVGSSDEVCVCVGVELATADPAVAIGVREQIDIVLPHLCRAAELDRRLRTATERINFGGALLDQLPFGLLWFDESEAVIYANAEAHRISRLRDGFSIVANRARARSSTDDVVLQAALREAIASDGNPYTRRFSLDRNDRRPYAALLTTLPHPRAVGRHQPSCVLFVTDVEKPVAIEPESLADMLGLTTAEAKVVAHLAMGVSLREMAGKLNVSINTARTLLARAMAKTGTNTQIALVRMVLTTLVPIGQSKR